MKLKIVVFAIALFSLFFLTYKLGNFTLHPWDEAWYGSIAKNVLRGQALDLHFNGAPYWDHPPLGFYFIAISYKLLGISEFSTRLPMALLGTGAIIAIFCTGKILGNTATGIASSLVLISCRWFLLRARSGNLEMPLLFFQILSFFFAYRQKTSKDIYLSWFFFSLSLLSKSVISFTMLPLLLISTYNFYKSKKPKLSILNSKLLIILTCAILPLLPWYGYNTVKYGPKFLQQNVLKIGLRNSSSSGISMETTQRTLLYLRSSMHKWYLPLLASIAISLLYLKSRPVRWSLSYLMLSAFPYFLSKETQIWHLLTIFPPAALLISQIPKEILSSLPKPKQLSRFTFVIPVLAMLVAINSLNSYWKEFIDLPQTVTHEARLAIESRKYPYRLILQDNTYMPTVVFYADQVVDITQTTEIIKNKQRPFQLISHTYLVQEQENYEIVAQSGDTVLALFK